MKFKKPKRNDILWFAVVLFIALYFLIPSWQIVLHKGWALFSPSAIKEEKRETLIFEDWPMRDLNGQVFNFKDAEGKVIFLNFWATWCPPCIAEMPAIQGLYDNYKEKVEFVLVSNESVQTIQAFFEKKGYELPVFRSLTDYPESFKIRSIPRTYLISKEGEIVIDKKGAANWNSASMHEQIDALLK